MKGWGCLHTCAPCSGTGCALFDCCCSPVVGLVAPASRICWLPALLLLLLLLLLLQEAAAAELQAAVAAAAPALAELDGELVAKRMAVEEQRRRLLAKQRVLQQREQLARQLMDAADRLAATQAPGVGGGSPGRSRLGGGSSPLVQRGGP